VKEGDKLEDLGVDRSIMLKWFLKGIMYENMDWVHLAQDGDKWRAVVNMVVNFQILSNARTCPVKELLTS
jgi:hypothetical protein